MVKDLQNPSPGHISVPALRIDTQGDGKVTSRARKSAQEKSNINWKCPGQGVSLAGNVTGLDLGKVTGKVTLDLGKVQDHWKCPGQRLGLVGSPFRKSEGKVRKCPGQRTDHIGLDLVPALS
jgi:hypothetical protein